MSVAAERFHVEQKPDIFTIQKERIDEFWPSIVPFLSMIETPHWTPDQVRIELLEGRAQLWGLCRHDGIMGVFVTRIEVGAVKFGYVWIVAGKGLDEGYPFYREHIEKWFCELGCEYIEFIGRKGWGRVLPDYEQSEIVFRKRLSHGRRQQNPSKHDVNDDAKPA